jgi:predicted transcriptional regulator
MPRKEKRTKLEIYYDILSAINNESSYGIVPTRIQQNCNMSYDKFSKYLKELEQKGLIHNPKNTITEKGIKLLQDYDKIKEFLLKMNMEYVKPQEVMKNVIS